VAPGHSAARSVSRLDGGRGAAIDGVAACGDARYARRGADSLRPGRGVASAPSRWASAHNPHLCGMALRMPR
jgi:hypothetical protein